MQRMVITITVSGVNPVIDAAEDVMADMVRDHLEASGVAGYGITVQAAAWDEDTHEYRAAVLQSLLDVIGTVERQCKSSKLTSKAAIGLIDIIDTALETVEMLAKEKAVMKSVQLNLMTIEALTRGGAAHDHLAGLAYPSRKKGK